jgi:hypothetical protein
MSGKRGNMYTRKLLEKICNTQSAPQDGLRLRKAGEKHKNTK